MPIKHHSSFRIDSHRRLPKGATCNDRDASYEIGRILARAIVAASFKPGSSSEISKLIVNAQETAEDILMAHGGQASCASLAAELGVAARNRLNELLKDGKVKIKGRGPATVYILKEHQREERHSV